MGSHVQQIQITIRSATGLDGWMDITQRVADGRTVWRTRHHYLRVPLDVIGSWAEPDIPAILSWAAETALDRLQS